MTTESDAADAGRDQQHPQPERPGDVDVDAFDRLEFRSVEYPNSPDRATIYPPELTGMAQLETWLSANSTAFVDLEAWR